MKLVKTFSLAAVAAIAAMAFVGASAASANPENVVLCEEPELLCNPVNEWPDPTTIVFHAVSPKLLSSLGTIECEKSLLELTFLNLLKKLLEAHILSWTLEGNCHLGSTKCTATVQEGGSISFMHGAHLLEWVGRFVSLILKETSMNTVVNFKCGFIINCTYTLGEEGEAIATDSETGVATLTANKTSMERSSGFCPENSKLDATYVSLGGGYWLES